MAFLRGCGGEGCWYGDGGDAFSLELMSMNIRIGTECYVHILGYIHIQGTHWGTYQHRVHTDTGYI